MAAGDLMDVAVKAAEEQFKLSASTIYEIYDTNSLLHAMAEKRHGAAA
jgi:hypothetical protein